MRTAELKSERPLIIGLGGLLRSGKDAIADYLVEKHGFVKLGMSDPLHEALLALNPLIGIGVRMQEEMVFGGNNPGFHRIKETAEVRYSDAIDRLGYVEAKKDPEVRALLQRLGTEVGRKIIGEETWTDVAVNRINALVAEGKSVVITGVRFPNEVSMFDRVNGARVTTGWVQRVSLEHPSNGQATHASETSVSAADFDVTIHNDGTLADLYATADSTFQI